MTGKKQNNWGIKDITTKIITEHVTQV